jgi:hypothetical protein
MPDLQRYTDEELHDLINSEVGERKKAIAAEILRRRRQQKWSKWAKRSSVLAALLTAMSSAAVGVRWWFRK